jgi:hypothetical protein
VTRDLLGRRGRAIDPAWANRRLLLCGRERLSSRALARMWNGCLDHDPTGAILTAKEELRALCATAARGGHRDQISQRLWAFYTWCADANIPELTTLAETVETWSHQRSYRGHEQVDQAGETRRLWIPKPRQLPPPSTVALHPANRPIVSEESDGARLRSKSRLSHAQPAEQWKLGE